MEGSKLGLRLFLRASLGWAQSAALLLALITPVYFAIVVLGVRMEFWDWRFAIDPLLQTAGPVVIGACLAAGIVALILVILGMIYAPREANSLVAPLLALIVAGGALGWKIQADRVRTSVPMVIDIATDAEAPPTFSGGFHARREPWATSLDYAAKRDDSGRPLSDVQHDVYPGLQSLRLDEPPRRVFSLALRIARDQGWRVGAAAPETGHFEATAESLWMGFRDDMAVRIVETDVGGSVLDVRALAREDVHDLGRVARRVRRFLDAVEAEAAPQGVAIAGDR